MNPYEVIEEQRDIKVISRDTAILHILIISHRTTYLVLMFLGTFFYWRSDATSLGEILGWVGIIGICIDTLAVSIGNMILGKNND